METKYSVILKGKRGEQTAVKRLSTRSMERTFVTFEIPPIPMKFKKDDPGTPDGPKYTLSQHLESFSHGMISGMRPGFEFGVDFTPLARHAIEQATLIESVIRPLKAAGLKPIPVLGLNEQCPHFRRIVDFCSKGRSSFVVRVTRPECNFPGAIVRQVAELAQTTAIPTDSIRLLFDFGSITPGDIEDVAATSAALEEELPLSDYAMASTVAASMPESHVMLLGLKYGESDRIPRAEWDAWKQAGLLQIGFGDYGITHPDDYADIDFRLITLGGKIRYTTRDAFVVIKGKKLKGNSDQFHYLARCLRDLGCCNAPTYSWGDREIAACAQRTRGPGSLETWIAFSTNHHLTMVSRQHASAA